MVEFTKYQLIQQNHLFNSRWDQAFENDGSGNPLYWGEAEPGTSKNAAGWRIKKLTWTGGNVTDIQWAENSTAMNLTWSARASYTYGG